MSPKKRWNPWDSQSLTITLDDLRKLKPSESIHPLSKLKQIIKNQIYAGFIILFVFLLLAFIFSQLLLTIVLFPVCLYLAYFLFRSFTILRTMSKINNQPNENILKAMKWQYSAIKKYVKTSETVAVFLYPLSIMAGMILTFLLIEDGISSDLFKDPYFVYLFIAALLVFVPLQHLFTKKMNRKTFGSHLEYLKEMTDKLESEV